MAKNKFEIHLEDFVPPIFIKSIGFIKRAFHLSEKDHHQGIQPFISPAMDSYSQFNEDLLLDVLLSFEKNGSYLDIGANDPVFNSNTNRFYHKGWTGINIEPGPGGYQKFCSARPKDINLNIGVGPVDTPLTFYQVVGDSTLSSFDKDVAHRMAKRYGLTVAETSIPVLRLETVFLTYIKERRIDFMSVDAEGYDLEVLQSNNWNKYRPTIAMVEIDNQYKTIVEFLGAQDYCLIFNNYHNGIFLDNHSSVNTIQAITRRCSKL